MFNKRILKEIKQASESRDFKFIFDDEGLYGEKNYCYIIWKVVSGLYENQEHVLQIKFIYGPGGEKTFPKSPPNVLFMTPIFHTNISTGGSICVDILKEGNYNNQYWSPMYNINTIFNSIILLLDEHNVKSPFNADASTMYSRKSPDEFKKICWDYYCERKNKIDNNIKKLME